MDPQSPLTTPIVDDALKTSVRSMLENIGISATEISLTPLSGGGNNRVYRVATASGLLLLKVYFRHPGDQRDRLKVEYDFTTFAWEHGLRQVPRPLTWDLQAGLALYEFIEGRRLESGEVDDNAVRQALAFYHELNKHRHDPQAQHLPAGSEACFCFADHLNCVERRLVRFASWQPQTDVDRRASKFVEAEVQPRWRQVRSYVEAEAGKLGFPATAPLPAEARRLSPSDFGFHNALQEATGQLRFVDFRVFRLG